MYIPKPFLITDKAEKIAFMRQYGFATIVTAENNFPTATHLPFVVCETENSVVLKSHFAKANPQWKELATKQCLVIFSEPHAYISPKHYESELNVPTWNYISVHAYGNGNIISDSESSAEVIQSMIEYFDPQWLNNWQKMPQDYRQRMMNGIVPFEVEITGLQGQKKLSQNKTAGEQHKIAEALTGSGNKSSAEIAAYMKKYPGGFPR